MKSSFHKQSQFRSENKDTQYENGESDFEFTRGLSKPRHHVNHHQQHRRHHHHRGDHDHDHNEKPIYAGVPNAYYKLVCDVANNRSAAFVGKNHGEEEKIKIMSVHEIENRLGIKLFDAASCNTKTVNPNDWFDVNSTSFSEKSYDELADTPISTNMSMISTYLADKMFEYVQSIEDIFPSEKLDNKSLDRDNERTMHLDIKIEIV